MPSLLFVAAPNRREGATMYRGFNPRCEDPDHTPTATKAGAQMGNVLLLAVLTIAAQLIAGCADNAKTNAISYLSPLSSQSGLKSSKGGQLPVQPALISLDGQTGALEYWQIQQGGNQNAVTIYTGLGIASAYGMAADGNVLAIASYSPSEIVTYDLLTQVELTEPDPNGPPIDLAIAKGDSIYALNSATVNAYPEDRAGFRILRCQYIDRGVAIAADNEGDLFVNGYGPGGFMGVVEFPFPLSGCKTLNLKPELGTAAGVGVDPQTDNLIVVDNPGSCSGSGDARMTVYSKPYGPKTGTRTSLGGLNCAGTFRLDATSSNMFVEALTAGGAITQIDQLSYPGANNEGSYGSSDPPGGITTLPNTLPN
jgi:hypothetical protein